ncbi:sigma factor-like helix-turn-helix DNA-binding protein [Pseudonocardia sulfidoxydans]|nr:sigma factor-like helix-turn-helix DNA-binding protein [Pseudonocardia sulfidoxydans]
MHRLGDRLLADRVGAQVVAGMLRKPGVFRFFGLPYSARIGHLAEARIAEAKAGRRDQIAEWDRILRSLRSIPAPDRDAFVLTCVQGLEVPEIAGRLGLTDQEARRLIDTALGRMRAIADEELGDETSAASQTE